MKKLLTLSAIAFFTAIVMSAYPQSLAELAHIEKKRREEIEDGTRVITNIEVAKYKSGPVTTFSSSGNPAPKPESQAESTKDEGEVPELKGESDEPVDFQGRPESYWRKTMAEARQRVKELENEAEVIILKLNDLQNQFYREDDGFKREGIQRDIQKTIYEQDKNKEELAKAKDELRDLEKEARKSGALPGWLK